MPATGLAEISTMGWASEVTPISTVSVASSPSASVTTSTTVKVPSSTKVCVASWVLAVAPSPKFHEKVKGASPLTTSACRLTTRGLMPTSGSAWICTVGCRSRTASTVTWLGTSSPSASVTVHVAT